MKNKNIRMIVSLVLNLLIIIVGVYVVFTVGTKAYTFGNKIFNEQAMTGIDNEREVEVTITNGMTAKKVAKLLCDKGLADDETITYFQIQLSDYKDKIAEGTYTLRTSMTPTDIMKEISAEAESDLE